MGKFILKRLIFLSFILLSVSFLVFISIRLIPGDPAKVMLGERATKESIVKLKKELGLDQPLLKQYFYYLANILKGDLGRSIFSNNRIIDDIKEKFPATIELAISSILIALPVGVLLGTLAAVYRNTWIDTLSITLATIGVSMPIFWLGLVLILIFSSFLGYLPVSGRIDITYEFTPITNFYLIDSILLGRLDILIDAIKHLILPAVTLSTIPASIITRMTRTSMIEILSKEYIKLAYAKGLSKYKVILKHALKNAAIPISTVVGLQLGFLLGGVVITETIFAWNGLGSYLVNGVLTRDFPVVQGSVLIIAFTFVLINLIVDVLYFLFDPRLRTSILKD